MAEFLVGLVLGLLAGHFSYPAVKKLIAKSGGGPGEEDKSGGGPGEEDKKKK